MPEGPEVESARRLIHTHCVGKRITKVVAAEDSNILCDGLTASELTSILQGATVEGTGRKGKILWWTLAGPGKGRPRDTKHVLFHFGMTGSFIVQGQGAMKYQSFEVDESTWPPRFHKLVLEMEDPNDPKKGPTRVAYVDSRRFGKIWARGADLDKVPPISELGFDAAAPPPAEEFIAGLRARRTAVKAVLLDQGFSAGVGNWVADEILYQARVHPETPASSLSDTAARAIHDAMSDIMSLAFRVNADSDQFPKDWLFHHRWTNKKAGSKDAHGNRIEFVTVGGRTSAVVPALQKRQDRGEGKAAAKGKGKGKGKAAEGGEGEEEEEGAAGKTAAVVVKKRAVRVKKTVGPAPGEEVVEAEVVVEGATGGKGRKRRAAAAVEVTAAAAVPAGRGGVTTGAAEEDPHDSLVAACKTGDAKTAALLLQRGTDPDAGSYCGWPLRHCAERGDVGMINLLLDAGAAIAMEEWQSLRAAAKNDHLEAVRVLLERGANPSAWGSEALISAARKGNLAMCALLLDFGAKVSGWSDAALIVASGAGHAAVVELLLERGADPAAQRGAALEGCATGGHLGVLEAILRHPGVDVNMNDGVAMQRASMRIGAKGSAEFVKALLEHGADPRVIQEHGLRGIARSGLTGMVLSFCPELCGRPALVQKDRGLCWAVARVRYALEPREGRDRRGCFGFDPAGEGEAAEVEGGPMWCDLPADVQRVILGLAWL